MPGETSNTGVSPKETASDGVPVATNTEVSLCYHMTIVLIKSPQIPVLKKIMTNSHVKNSREMYVTLT